MGDSWDPHMTAIEMLELELIIRDFVAILNEGHDHEIHAFLADDVVHKPSARQCITGRSAVVEMICDMRRSFADCHTELVDIAVSGSVVLAELAMRLTRPATEPLWIMSFASFRVDAFRISAWHQLHS